MVANVNINPTNVEATAYISAVAAFAVVVLVVLLFLGRRWCYTAVFGRKCCDDILTVNAAITSPGLPIENAPFDALSKPNHYPERIFKFEASDEDEELRLRVQQDKEEVECRYEEKNENQAQSKVEVELLEKSMRENSLRETKIDEVVQQRADYIHTLEAQSSVDSDVLAHNDTSLLCEGGTGAGAGEGSSEGARGCVELTLLFDAPVRSMTVHVLQARGLQHKTTAQVLQSQVRIVLLPLKKQKYKSKIRNGENPQYMESFVLHKINPEDVHGMGLRIRIYGCERMRRQRLLGEANVSFATLNFELENNLWLQLAPRQHHQPSLQIRKLDPSHSIAGVLASPSSITTMSPGGSGEACSLARSDSASSCCSTRSAPELLLGLQYNPTTGHLSVEIIKGTHFRKLSPNKAPDTYVKLCLISSLGMEMGRCKSTTRRAQSNPLYKELFIFQVALFQLTEVTLMVSVWWRRSVKRNEMVGWFSLGHSSSGREEERHWHELCERQGQQVSEEAREQANGDRYMLKIVVRVLAGAALARAAGLLRAAGVARPSRASVNPPRDLSRPASPRVAACCGRTATVLVSWTSSRVRHSSWETASTANFDLRPFDPRSGRSFEFQIRSRFGHVRSSELREPCRSIIFGVLL